MIETRDKKLMNPKVEDADRLIKEADGLFNESIKLRNQAVEIYRQVAIRSLRKKKDKFINKKEALELLPFSSYPTLRKWIKKVQPLGYLNFHNAMILRSEVLRFNDDYRSGRIERMIHRNKESF